MPTKSPKKNKPLDYKSSGVDVEAGYRLVEEIKPFVKETKREEIISGLGSFSAMSRLPKNLENPVLVSCTDGVGTKIEIAKELDSFETIGIDLVAMCVNDLVTCGAEPLFFLDYYVTDSLNVGIASKVIKGISKGCKLSNCSLVGGETAEHPDSFPENSFDLAGFAVGVVDEKKIIGAEGAQVGDFLLGIESSGVHSNGFSLIRKILKENKVSLKESLGKRSLGEELLKPTRIYVEEVLELSKKIEIKSIGHITGGGFFENIPRMMGPETKVAIDFNFEEWPSNAIFHWIKEKGQITKENMLSTFNCGIGLILAINEKDIDFSSNFFNSRGLKNKILGSVESSPGNKPSINIV